MGCGCRKGKTQAQNLGSSASRTAVYQALGSDGAIVSEHLTPMDARNAAVQAGGRVRIVSRDTKDVVQ
jgi:hypothetical protein